MIDKAMPWLACIIYWVQKINVSSDWYENYSYTTALSGIGPSGSADSPKRVAYSLLFASLLGLQLGQDFIITSSSDGGGICNISLTDQVPPCAASGGGGSGKRSGYTITNKTNNWSTRIDCKKCHNYLCKEDDTNCGSINCKQSNCPNAATMCGSVSSEECPTVSPTPHPSGGGGSTDSYPTNPKVIYKPIDIYNDIMNIGKNPNKKKL